MSDTPYDYDIANAIGWGEYADLKRERPTWVPIAYVSDPSPCYSHDHTACFYDTYNDCYYIAETSGCSCVGEWDNTHDGIKAGPLDRKSASVKFREETRESYCYTAEHIDRACSAIARHDPKFGPGIAQECRQDIAAGVIHTVLSAITVDDLAEKLPNLTEEDVSGIHAIIAGARVKFP